MWRAKGAVLSLGARVWIVCEGAQRSDDGDGERWRKLAIYWRLGGDRLCVKEGAVGLGVSSHWRKREGLCVGLTWDCAPFGRARVE